MPKVLKLYDPGCPRDFDSSTPRLQLKIRFLDPRDGAALSPPDNQTLKTAQTRHRRPMFEAGNSQHLHVAHNLYRLTSLITPLHTVLDLRLAHPVLPRLARELLHRKRFSACILHVDAKVRLLEQRPGQ